jgi:hypothetical protein
MKPTQGFFWVKEWGLLKTVCMNVEAGNPLKHQPMLPTAKASLVCHRNQYGLDVFI